MKEGWILENLKFVWTFGTIALTIAIAFQINSTFEFRKEAPKYGVQINPFSDLYVMGLALCIISMYRQLAMAFITPVVRKILKKVDPECNEDKIFKNSRAVVGSIWYTFTTVPCDNLVVRVDLLLRTSVLADYLLGRQQVSRHHEQVAVLSGRYRHQELLHDTVGPSRAQSD